MTDQNQRVAVVTGSSRGIGRAIALQLARDGNEIVLHARAENADIVAVAQAIRELGRQAVIVTAELSTEANQNRFAEEAPPSP